MTSPKIALITGASRGLGRSMAQHLGRAGIGVLATDQHHRDEAEHLVAELQQLDLPAAALQLDVGNSATSGGFADTVRSTLRDLDADHLDYLVNNAGTGIFAPFAATTENQFDDIGAAVPAILSDGFGWATGTWIELSGGQNL